MPRQANPVDFWRGFALVTIFINHIPGIYYARFTHGNISISDSADLFVFLAGWSLRYLVGSTPGRVTTPQLMYRLSGRAIVIYSAQIVITIIAIAMLATAATLLDNPLILEWNNAAAVFYDPVPTHIGLALITHQLGYFDILPLYVVLMLAAPGIALIDRYAPNLVLPLSFALYCVVLMFRIIPPTWPVAGQWFFNPLAWQIIFVLGFVLARDGGIGSVVRQHLFWVRVLAVPIVIACLLIVWNGWWPDPTTLPQPRLFFINAKTWASPIRLIQFLAVVAVFSAFFPLLNRIIGPVTRFLSMLGRNSLPVFCIGSLLSLAGQIVRLISHGDIAVDTLVVVLGIAIMALTAWLSEWRDRIPRPARAASPASS